MLQYIYAQFHWLEGVSKIFRPKVKFQNFVENFLTICRPPFPIILFLPRISATSNRAARGGPPPPLPPRYACAVIRTVCVSHTQLTLPDKDE